MNASAAEDFFTEIFPIYLLFKWLGCSPFFVRGPPGSRRVEQVKSTFYLLVPYVAMSLTVFVFVTAASSSDFLRAQNLGLWFLFLFQLFSNFGALVPLTVFRKRYTDNVTKYCLKVLDVDEAMVRLGIKINHKRIQVKNSIRLAVQGGILMTAIGCGVYLRSTVSDLAYFTTFFCRSVGVFGACTTLYCTTERLHLLNVYLDQSESVDLVPFTKISAIIATLQGITHLTINSVVFLMELATDFSSLVVICYKFWRELFVANALTTGELVFYGLWMAYTLNEMLSLIHACHGIPESFREMQRLLFKTSVKDNGHNNSKEIIALCLQLTHNEPGITAGRLFTIDFRLIFSIIGALSTYLLILIQFDG